MDWGGWEKGLMMMIHFLLWVVCVGPYTYLYPSQVGSGVQQYYIVMSMPHGHIEGCMLVYHKWVWHWDWPCRPGHFSSSAICLLALSKAMVGGELLLPNLLLLLLLLLLLFIRTILPNKNTTIYKTPLFF